MGTGGWDKGAVEQAQARVNSAGGKPRYYIGIDPGTCCGLAVWDSATRSLIEVTSGKAIEMEQRVLHLCTLYDNVSGCRTNVIVEDTRNLYVPSKDRFRDVAQKLQGVGAVKRDMTRWEDFCTFHDLDFTMQPISKHTPRKMPSADFKRLTGWERATNHNSRDAACIVFGK